LQYNQGGFIIKHQITIKSIYYAFHITFVCSV